MEQYEMNFDAPKRPKEMTDKELRDEYEKVIKVKAQIGMSREVLIGALEDPETHYAELLETARQSDEDDRLRDSRRR